MKLSWARDDRYFHAVAVSTPLLKGRPFALANSRLAMASLEARGASTLLRHSFDDALRSHGWNDSREPVIGGIEQTTKLSLRPFPSSGHY